MPRGGEPSGRARRSPGRRRRLAVLLREAPAFAAVGAIGFLAHAALLALLVRGAGLPPYPAWFPAFAASVALTYALNRRWTFRHRAGPAVRRELARYALLQAAGATVNNLVYAAALWLHPLFRAEPVLALAAGSGVAMVANYLSARGLAFTGAGATRGAVGRSRDGRPDACALDAGPGGTVMSAAAEEPRPAGNEEDRHA